MLRGSARKAARAAFSRNRASPSVKRSWLDSGACRFGAMTTRSIRSPTRKNAGPTMKTETYGSTPPRLQRKNVAYMPSIISVPWAKLMMRSTPNTSVSPSATSA